MDTSAASAIRAYVDRVLRLKEDIKALNADVSDIYKEAAGNGFDKKALQATVNRAALPRDDLQEQDALVDLYWSAYTGTSVATRARAPTLARLLLRVHVHPRRPPPLTTPTAWSLNPPRCTRSPTRLPQFQGAPRAAPANQARMQRRRQTQWHIRPIRARSPPFQSSRTSCPRSRLRRFPTS